MRKEETLPLATMYTSPEDSVLSETSQTQEHEYAITSLLCRIWESNSQKQRPE